MRVAVADTGPLNYLALTGMVGILPELFGSVCIPEAVGRELSHPQTPGPVREWLAAAPVWLVIHNDSDVIDPTLRALDLGEREAVLLALKIKADLILMDDRAGVVAARSRAFAVTGTLGLLDLAARRQLIDLPEAVARLRETSFRCRPAMLDELLERHSARRSTPRSDRSRL